MALLAAGAAYTLSVGFAARLWLWLMSWDWHHDDNFTSCGTTMHDFKIRCPGCRHRVNAWWLAAFWPVTLAVGAISLTIYRSVRALVEIARLTGPRR